MQQFLNIEQFEAMRAYQIRKKANFHEIETKKKRFLKVGKTRYYLSSDPREEQTIPLPSLGMLHAAKKDILKNYYEKKPNFVNNIKVDLFQCIKQPFEKTVTQFETEQERTEAIIKFFKEGRSPNAHKFEGEVIQIDINAAYVQEAFNMGLLSKHIFDRFFEEEKNEKQIKKYKKDTDKQYKCSETGKILKHPKKVRLIALGSLAQDKAVSVYQSGVLVQTYRDFNEEEANIFFTIARRVGENMIKVIEECKTAKFSFVDAVFVEESDFQKACKILRGCGYGIKYQRYFMKQTGGRFSSWKIYEDGTLKKKPKEYFISTGKTPAMLNCIYTDNFLRDIIETYKKIEGEGSSTDTLNRSMVKALKSKMTIDSLKGINTIYLAKELKKYGLLLEDIFRVKVQIKEDFIDSFGIFSTIITDRILKIQEAELFITSYEVEEKTGKTGLLGEDIIKSTEIEINLI